MSKAQKNESARPMKIRARNAGSRKVGSPKSTPPAPNDDATQKTDDQTPPAGDAE